MIQGLADEEFRDLILSVGTHRGARRLSPIEVSRLIVRALQAGSTAAELAEACHLQGTSMIGRFRRLSDLPDDLQDLVDWGSPSNALSMSQAQELARLKDTEAQRAVGLRILQDGLSSQDVRQVVQRIERSDDAPNEAVESILRLRPVVRRQYLLVGAVTDPTLRDRIAGLPQSVRDAAFAGLLATVDPSLKGKLGTQRFTVTAQDQVGARLNADVLESLVNERLSQHLSGAP